MIIVHIFIFALIGCARGQNGTCAVDDADKIDCGIVGTDQVQQIYKYRVL